MKINLAYPKSAAMECFQLIQERVRDSRGERPISVQAAEGPLYLQTKTGHFLHSQNILTKSSTRLLTNRLIHLVRMEQFSGRKWGYAFTPVPGTETAIDI